jgi:antidote-toxin recognition MazE-like antitoxin
VPDTRSPEFLAELRAQSLALARASADDEILDWIEANADLDDWK